MALGKQLAIQYASPHVHLILIARDMEKLTQVAQICQDSGAEITCKDIDIRNAELLEKFILDVDSKTPIDLVIANAGCCLNIAGRMATRNWGGC